MFSFFWFCNGWVPGSPLTLRRGVWAKDMLSFPPHFVIHFPHPFDIVVPFVCVGRRISDERVALLYEQVGQVAADVALSCQII